MESFEIKDKKIDTMKIKNQIKNRKTISQTEEQKLQEMRYDVLMLKEQDERVLYDFYLQKKQLQKLQTPYFLPGRFYFLRKLRFRLTKLFSGKSDKNRALVNDTIDREVEDITKKILLSSK